VGSFHHGNADTGALDADIGESSWIAFLVYADASPIEIEQADIFWCLQGIGNSEPPDRTCAARYGIKRAANLSRMLSL
jgi:hypothetical protein